MKTLAVVIPKEPDFTVIYDRGKQNVAPPAYKFKDDKKSELISTYIIGLSCRSILTEGLVKALQDAGRFSTIAICDRELQPKEIDRYDAVAFFHVNRWGIWLNDPNGDKLAAFIEINVEMVETQKGQLIWVERDIGLGLGRHTFDAYHRNKDLLRNELEKVAQEWGCEWLMY